MRALECPRCGAPAPGEPGVHDTTCRFCGARLLLEPKATRPRVPQAPRQPQSANSAQPMVALVIVGSLAAVVLAGGVFALQTVRGQTEAGGSLGASGVPGERLLAFSTNQSAAAAATHFQTTVRKDKHVDVQLRDSPVERAHLNWNDAAHVTSITLSLREATDLNPILASLGKQFGPAFREASTGSHQLSASGVSLSVSRSITLSAHSLDKVGWQDRFNAMWTAIQHAVFQTGAALDVTTKRDKLNLGYEASALKQIDFRVSLEQSNQEMSRHFPGVEARDTTLSLGLGHPLFESASFKWNNEPKGKLSHTNLYFWAPKANATSLAAIQGCLEPALGAPTRRDTDYAKGQYSLDWPARGGVPRVHATVQLVMLFPSSGGKQATTPAGWSKALDALSSCK